MSKKIYSLAAMAALLSMASCSSDEPVNGGNQGGIADGEYLAFTISNVANGSRAIETSSEDAVGNEGVVDVNNVRFYFYDANKNAFNFAASQNVNGTVNAATTMNMVVPSQIDMTENSDGSDATTGVLVLGKPEDTGYIGAVPSYVLCIANADGDE